MSAERFYGTKPRRDSNPSLPNISGGAEIAKALADFPLAMEVALMRGGLRAGAVIIADEAKARLKAHGSVQTHALLDSIRVRTGKKRGNTVYAYVTAGDRKLNRDSKGNYKTGSRYNNPWYAHLVEYGTRAHVIIAGGATKFGKALAAAGRILGEKVDHPGAPPKPFMRPALDSKTQASIDAVANYLRNRIEQGK